MKHRGTCLQRWSVHLWAHVMPFCHAHNRSTHVPSDVEVGQARLPHIIHSTARRHHTLSRMMPRHVGGSDKVSGNGTRHRHIRPQYHLALSSGSRQASLQMTSALESLQGKGKNVGHIKNVSTDVLNPVKNVGFCGRHTNQYSRRLWRGRRC